MAQLFEIIMQIAHIFWTSVTALASIVFLFIFINGSINKVQFSRTFAAALFIAALSLYLLINK